MSPTYSAIKRAFVGQPMVNVSTKFFVLGACIVASAIPVLVVIFYGIRRHHRGVKELIEPQNDSKLEGLARGRGSAMIGKSPLPSRASRQEA